ncbi:MAG: hypothetical protein D6741_14630, partial [Planctomycetota bacterium]
MPRSSRIELLSWTRRDWLKATGAAVVTSLSFRNAAAESGEAADVWSLQATAHDRRVDLRWTADWNTQRAGFLVYRARHEGGPFECLTASPHQGCVFSDFVGENDSTFHYRITDAEGKRPSAIVSAVPRAMGEEELLTSVQEATFRYFWDYGHPVSGLAFERARSGRLPDLQRRAACASGGTGFGLMAMMVGAERGFVSRADAAARVLKIVAFLQEKARRYHGAWAHWIDGRTGETIPFDREGIDDGADLVETSFLMQGMLAVRGYFDRSNAVETEIRERITQLWHEVEWDFFTQRPDEKRLYWHWSPNHGWKKNLPIVGYNECMITYLLAIASPTHPIPPDCYEKGWAGRPRYRNGNTYYGYVLPVGKPMGGPLFWTHYSFMGFDPRRWQDRYCNYFDNCRRTALIHHAYAKANPARHKDYGPTVWGLTACDGPDGYAARDPLRDDGTVAPTAALGSMPYTPDESIAAFKHYYYEYGGRLWGEFGFRDAFNIDRDWFANSYIAIDQG